MVEPRYLLDEDSLCYGCGYYKHVKDTGLPEEFTDDDLDENEGVCVCQVPCYGGSVNGHIMI